jgi:DNA-binding NtrC family response regulator
MFERLRTNAVKASQSQTYPEILWLAGSTMELLPECLSAMQAEGRCVCRTFAEEAQGAVGRHGFQLVIAHAGPGNENLASNFFARLIHHPLGIPVLAILPESANEQLRQVVLDVTDDFLFYPLRDGELSLRVERILKTRQGDAEHVLEKLQSEMGRSNLVGKHESFLRAVESTALMAGSKAPVLITGETGTGKELFAHAIHLLSDRRGGPFIPLDCGVLPEQLAENELFGHSRGAFTDAHTDTKGLVALADGGTLFLDEIDALSVANQAKLLRFLQEGSFRALGAERLRHANVRVIAASNRNMEECVRQRQFRSDLYFRINVLRLYLPPLRERTGDVALLAAHFLAGECDAAEKFLSPAALRSLEKHAWPGNVRELLNVLQRAALHAPGRQITPAHLSFDADPTQEQTLTEGPNGFHNAKQHVIREFERAYIEKLLASHNGNITQAAREAGKERRAFGKLVKKYGIRKLAVGSQSSDQSIAWAFLAAQALLPVRVSFNKIVLHRQECRCHPGKAARLMIPTIPSG